MIKQFRLSSIIFLLLLLLSLCSNDNIDNFQHVVTSVYEGIDGYGTHCKDTGKSALRYIFNIDGKSITFNINSNDNEYTLQNTLQEGARMKLTLSADDKICKINIENALDMGSITSISNFEIEIDGKPYYLSNNVKFMSINRRAGRSDVFPIPTVKKGDLVKIYGNPVEYVDLTFVPEDYNAPITPTPGLRTIKNFLATALSACGTTLYIYGGGWNWQDNGSSIQSRKIGIPREWIDFFQMNDASFQYKNADATKSYYSNEGFNEYYYAGADCSGFVGWAIYNVFNKESGKQGFVVSSAKMSHMLSEAGYGTISKCFNKEDFLPGDIMSIKGHVWICIGKSKDNSIVILHSTVNDMYGSGVQISALSDTDNCDAIRLAKYYMQTYYPTWSKRYDALDKSYKTYTNLSNENAGRFSWYISPAGLQDPDGYIYMSAEEILEDLYK